MTRRSDRRKRNYALLAAIQTGDLALAATLLDGGANANARDSEHGQLPLMIASGYGTPEMVALLISKGADVNAVDDRGRTALMCATWVGDRSSDLADRRVQVLIETGANVNAADDNGNSVLIWAVSPDISGGRVSEIIDRLLIAGANVQAINNRGNTVLMMAVELEPDLQVVQRLLAEGASVSPENIYKQTVFDLLPEDATDVRQLLSEAQT